MVKKTRYTDFGYWDKNSGKSKNVIYNSSVDKFIFIDTEDGSFSNVDRKSYKKLSPLVFLLGMMEDNAVDIEGEELLKKQTEEDFNNCTVLTHSSEFDDPEIDFEKVKIEKKQKEEQEIREALYESSAYGGGFIGLL